MTSGSVETSGWLTSARPSQGTASPRTQQSSMDQASGTGAAGQPWHERMAAAGPSRGSDADRSVSAQRADDASASDEPTESTGGDAPDENRSTTDGADGQQSQAAGERTGPDKVEAARASNSDQEAATDESDQDSTSEVDPLLAWIMGLLQGASTPASKGGMQGHGVIAQGTTRGQSLPVSGKALPVTTGTNADSTTADSSHFDFSKLMGDSKQGKPANDALLSRLMAVTAGGRGADGKAGGVLNRSVDLSFLAGAVAQSSAQGSQINAASVQGSVGTQSLARFDQTLSQNLMWMVSHGVRDARLRVNPQQLGPIDIQVKLDGDKTHVTFHSSHAQVRHALSEAAPRLRTILGDVGLNLAQVDVGAQGFLAGQHQQGGHHPFGSGNGGRGSVLGPAEGSAGTDSAQVARLVRYGLIDTFA